MTIGESAGPWSGEMDKTVQYVQRIMYKYMCRKKSESMKKKKTAPTMRFSLLFAMHERAPHHVVWIHEDKGIAAHIT